MKNLSEGQLRALDALTAGKTYADAATAAGTDRPTVWKWLTTDAGFVSEYNRRKAEAQANARARVDRLWAKALDVVETALDAEPGTALKAAALLMTASGRQPADPPGPTDAEGVALVWAGEETDRSLERLRANMH